MDRIKYLISKIFKFNKIHLHTTQTNSNGGVQDDSYKQQIWFYKTQPYEYYIRSKLNNLYILSKKFFSSKNLVIKIGIEIEFYILDEKISFNTIYEKIKNFANNNNINIINIEKERGNNQVEIQFEPYTDIDKLIYDYNFLKNFLLKNFLVTFDDMPYDNDAGSALQVNISIYNNDKNLFARKEEKLESDFLLNSIAGLLETINLFLVFYLSPSKNDSRYNKNINEFLYKHGKIPAPTYISWGINNRTCAIRIPTPKNINDFENYFNDDAKNRRIEFRIPSADSNLKSVIYCVLNSIAYGIYNNIMPIKPTYNNVLVDFSTFEKIELKNTYNFSDYYKVLKVLF